MKTFNVYWSSLTDEAKLEVLELVSKSEKELMQETNWDVLPITEIILGDEKDD
jgi:hypothetical protein